MYIKVVEAQYNKSLERAYEKGFEKGKEFNKDDQNLNYRVGYNDGWHNCEVSFELGNKDNKTLKTEAWKEGYDQCICDLIEEGVLEDTDEEYSEYKFGDVDDEEEEYCFIEELKKVLGGEYKHPENPMTTERKHSHYFKDVRHLDYVDIYQVCKLFEVEDSSHCTQHSIKKLLMSGKRGAKDKIKDITEARDTLSRYLQIEGYE